MTTLTSELLLAAYAKGFFPMARARDAKTIEWFFPEERGVMPLDARFHVPSSLKKFMKKCHYEVRFDTAFVQVVKACADTPRGDGAGTWINDEIIEAYHALHQLGHAHSVECWEGEALVGGLYGVSIGAAFFGESMFSTRTNASKVALIALVEHLRSQGYVLLDTQYVNEHLLQFGVLEVPHEEYLKMLEAALDSVVSHQ